MEPHRSITEPYRPPIAELKSRIGRQRRRYGRGLGRRPTSEELDAMRRAAELKVIAAHARAVGADANTLVRLDNCASRAEAAMWRLLDEANAPDGDYDPELAEMVR
jgi:hypothetical protein